jgi:uncharacterized protein (DUF433 family)
MESPNDAASPIKIDPEIMHGTPCFAGTRVPVTALFDYLEDGYNIDYFLLQYPTVEKGQAQAVLALFREEIPKHARRVAG